ncbi:hypothetical protein [Roseibium sp. LAB1]
MLNIFSAFGMVRKKFFDQFLALISAFRSIDRWTCQSSIRCTAEAIPANRIKPAKAAAVCGFVSAALNLANVMYIGSGWLR